MRIRVRRSACAITSGCVSACVRVWVGGGGEERGNVGASVRAGVGACWPGCLQTWARDECARVGVGACGRAGVRACGRADVYVCVTNYIPILLRKLYIYYSIPNDRFM